MITLLTRHLFASGLIALALLFSGLSIAQDESVDQYGVVKDGVRHVTAKEAAEIIKNNPSIDVLDVRTGFEYKRGHLERSTNVNYYSLSFKKKLAKLDRNKTWLVHCKSGVRSGKTLPIMKELGFTSVIHMDGGIDSWRAAKLAELK